MPRDFYLHFNQFPWKISWCPFWLKNHFRKHSLTGCYDNVWFMALYIQPLSGWRAADTSVELKVHLCCQILWVISWWSVVRDTVCCIFLHCEEKWTRRRAAVGPGVAAPWKNVWYFFSWPWPASASASWLSTSLRITRILLQKVSVYT